MAASDGRSLSSSVSIPQWMKKKMDTFDFEQSAFSPTELDDSFLLYYRYPKDQYKETNNNSTSTTTNSHQNLDVSKYTLPCQKYLKDGNQCATAQRVVYPIPAKIKSSGVDDGFKGEAAKCGSSIISLANMMVSGRVVKGFEVENKEEIASANGAQTPIQEDASNLMRRGSKSLPATPLGSPHNSPRSRRRVNKYFTSPFVESEKHQGSWILSNLLAQRENVSQSHERIAEEDSEDARSLSPKSARKNKPSFVPKPSELREMNFWSPTSM